ncbi:MAG TPA: copper chaperone PCu(A)C [Moraxellaceae bacterium]|nr:copper chaperone PCu(A)C [Moraxellaceae bacterium]
MPRNALTLPVALLCLGLAAPTLAAGAASGGMSAAAHGEASRSARPVVEAVWIGEAPPGARHGAAYLRLRNGARADALLAVETPVAQVVELHATTQEQGLTRMEQESTLALAPGAVVELAPGGRHLMLINLRRALKPGERVPLTLRFRHAGLVTVEAEVRPLAVDGPAAPPGGHHHHGH